MEKSIADSRWQQRLTELDELPYNYDASEYVDGQPGWNVDHYEQSLPAEAPGAPIDGGSFEVAKNIITRYEFPDPTRIVGHFRGDAGLDGRTMLLEAKFLWMTFTFGVRVSKVVDDRIQNDHGQWQTRYGYAYRTLQGHWEIGEMQYLIVKNEASGDVRFVVDAYSRYDRIANPLHRIGFKLLGRRLQKQFAQTCLVRLHRMVRDRCRL